MSIEVTKNDQRSRYEISVDGDESGFADYQERGSQVVLPHTVIDPAARGQGLAALLVRFALDDIRSRGRSVVPACSYVSGFIAKSPEYADLVAD